MKYLFITFLLASLSFTLSPFAQAHGGVEKSSGNTVVYLSQSPISPLVGEDVKMNFVIGRPGSLDRLQNLDVKVSVTDTNEDESKDTVVFTADKKTDANGSFDFSYQFGKVNYFDIDLSYIDPATGEEQETGFLIQTRDAGSQNVNFDPPPKDHRSVVFLILGIIIGIIIARSWKTKKPA